MTRRRPPYPACLIARVGADGIFVLGDGNTVERNLGKHNAGNGIVAVGSFNQLDHNQGHNSIGQGVLAVGGDNLSDERNYGDKNGVKPDCEIDGQSVPGTGGTYC